jgi:hypothetical protein
MRTKSTARLGGSSNGIAMVRDAGEPVDQLTAIRNYGTISVYGSYFTVDYYLSVAQHFPKLESRP